METFVPNNSASPRSTLSTAYSPKCLLEISLDNISENNLIGKIINQDDSNRGSTVDSLYLIVQTGNNISSVSICKLANMEPIF
jgi:hypothetical protein